MDLASWICYLLGGMLALGLILGLGWLVPKVIKIILCIAALLIVRILTGPIKCSKPGNETPKISHLSQPL